MDENQQNRLSEIKDKVARGEYNVDPDRVADAIVRRWGDSAMAHAKRVIRVRDPHTRERGQSECSYPESGPSASVKARPGGPATTRPTHVTSPRPPGLRRILSIVPQTLGAADTQSS